MTNKQFQKILYLIKHPLKLFSKNDYDIREYCSKFGYAIVLRSDLRYYIRKNMTGEYIYPSHDYATVDSFPNDLIDDKL